MSNNYTLNLSFSACFEYDVIYTGNPLNKANTTDNNYGSKDANECKTLCQNTARCGWFNVDKGQCFLKTARGTKKKKKGAVTGPKHCDKGIN